MSDIHQVPNTGLAVPLETNGFIDFGISDLLKTYRLQNLKNSTIYPIVRKFANVNRSKIPGPEFLTLDGVFLKALQRLSDDLKNPYYQDDPAFRKTMLQTLLYQPRMFYTFRKILEILFSTQPSYESGSEVPLDARVGSAVLGVLISGSDLLENFGRRLCHEQNLMEIFARFMVSARTGYMDGTLSQGSNVLLSEILTIVHNCAMFSVNKDRLIKAGILDALKPYLEKKDSPSETEIVLSIADLSEDDFASKLQMSEVHIRKMIACLKKGALTDHRNADGWHVLELVKGLGRLSLNEVNRTAIKDADGVDILLHLVNSKVEEEKHEAILAVLNLSGDHDILRQIRGDMMVMGALKTFVNSTVDERHLELARNILEV